MKKLFLRAEFGPLWGPWEVDETPRKDILIPSFQGIKSDRKRKLLINDRYTPVFGHFEMLNGSRFQLV